MSNNYLKLDLRYKTIYFIVDITSTDVYCDHDIIYKDYIMKIKDVETSHDDYNIKYYNGLILYVDEYKNVKILDNVNKHYIDLEENNDINTLTIYYRDRQYFMPLMTIIKDIIYDIFVNDE